MIIQVPVRQLKAGQAATILYKQERSVGSFPSGHQLTSSLGPSGENGKASVQGNACNDTHVAHEGSFREPSGNEAATHSHPHQTEQRNNVEDQPGDACATGTSHFNEPRPEDQTDRRHDEWQSSR